MICEICEHLRRELALAWLERDYERVYALQQALKAHECSGLAAALWPQAVVR